MKKLTQFLLSFASANLLTLSEAQVIGPFTNTFLQGSAANANDSLNYTNIANNTSNYSLTSTATAYDVIDDSTGARRTGAPPPVPFSDLPDFFISSTLTVLSNPPNTPATSSQNARLNPTGDPSRIQHSVGYTGNSGTMNPGTLLLNQIFVRFAAHLNVTTLSLELSSVNTSGVAWEYSSVQFLDDSMNPFSVFSGYNLNNNGSWVFGAPGQYLNAQGTNPYHLGGYSGQAGLGNYIMADTRTVYNVNDQYSPADNRTFSATTVGSAIVQPSTLSLPNPIDGTANNITVTEAMVGLSGQRIGGFLFTQYLEDVRDVGNGVTNFTASLLSLTITYTIPEPKQIMIFALLLVFTGIIIRRKLRI